MALLQSCASLCATKQSMCEIAMFSLLLERTANNKKAAFWAGLLHIGNLGIPALWPPETAPLIPLLTTIFFAGKKSFVGSLSQKKMT